MDAPPLRILSRPVDNGAGASFRSSITGAAASTPRSSLFTIMANRTMDYAPDMSICGKKPIAPAHGRKVSRTLHCDLVHANSPMRTPTANC